MTVFPFALVAVRVVVPDPEGVKVKVWEATPPLNVRLDVESVPLAPLDDSVTVSLACVMLTASVNVAAPPTPPEDGPDSV